MPIELLFIITLAIYNMTTTIEKRKVKWEGREVVYIALIEQMWVHRRILGWILVEWHTSQTKLFIECITQSSNDQEGPTSKLFNVHFAQVISAITHGLGLIPSYY